MEVFQKPEHPRLVFTDLDDSLLDHDNYGFDAALPLRAPVMGKIKLQLFINGVSFSR